MTTKIEIETIVVKITKKFIFTNNNFKKNISNFENDSIDLLINTISIHNKKSRKNVKQWSANEWKNVKKHHSRSMLLQKYKIIHNVVRYDYWYIFAKYSIHISKNNTIKIEFENDKKTINQFVVFIKINFNTTFKKFNNSFIDIRKLILKSTKKFTNNLNIFRCRKKQTTNARKFLLNRLTHQKMNRTFF